MRSGVRIPLGPPALSSSRSIEERMGRSSPLDPRGPASDTWIAMARGQGDPGRTGICLAMLLLLLLAACTSKSGQPSSGTTSAAGTEVTVFEPFTSSGALNADISVESTRSGTCWTTSDESRRPDTYRCMWGNYILDPCFSDPDALRRAVACVGSDGTDLEKVVMLRLAEPLPARYGAGEPASAGSLPLLVLLTDGTRCRPHQGTHAQIAGMSANFDCTNGASLVGDINRSQAKWTIQATVPGSSELTTDAIARVYV